ncbi:MAG: DHH family phosphoesterase [Candidatus Lokiarchaeota archaeon]|nr:DHH family phosphoesterase [Candidatus Lokiarchaeota archaeon]
MNEVSDSLQLLIESLRLAKKFLLDTLEKSNLNLNIYTHLDADGLSSGAILGKTFLRKRIPFQIRVLKQLEKEEIIKLAKDAIDGAKFIIFSDFGSGQYLELINHFQLDEAQVPFLILDHHLPQEVSNKEDPNIEKIHQDSIPWHINPYFYGIDGSTEISGSGLCYLFSKIIDKKNVDLSPIALVGATGDIQNRGSNHSFTGINSYILKDAIEADLIDEVDDLSFSPIKPINEAIAYSNNINLPGLTGNSSTTLKFLKTIGILMENPDGNIRTLNDLTQSEKRDISSKIIEYALKYEIDPDIITQNLIINRYILKNEVVGSELHELKEFSKLLNSCGRSENASLGIAIGMGDRRIAYQKAQENLVEYRKKISNALNWIQKDGKIKEMDYIQYFYGEDVIADTMIGTIASMLNFDRSGIINNIKPIFGCSKRETKGVYKISARASNKVVAEGVNLSEAIRKALSLSNLDELGGGHPPAAGTVVPIDKIELFLKNCDKIIKEQRHITNDTK